MTEMVKRVAVIQPLGVTIMNEREAFVELKEDGSIIEVS